MSQRPSTTPRKPRTKAATPPPATALTTADLDQLDHAQLLERATAIGFEITDEIRALPEDELREALADSIAEAALTATATGPTADPFAALRAELQPLIAGRRLADNIVLVGSAVMLLHGLRDEIGDVDAFVSPFLYQRLRSRWDELAPDPVGPPMLEGRVPGIDVPVHLWSRWPFDWMARSSTQAVFAQAEVGPHGWPCLPLATVRDWKLACIGRGREQDSIDIAAITEHLEGAA